MNAQELALFDVSYLNSQTAIRRPPHTDHAYYETIKEAEDHTAMTLRQSLDGVWLYTYVTNHSLYIKDFYKTDYNSSDFESIYVQNNINVRESSEVAINNDDPNSIGCYIKFFFLSQPLKGKRVFASLEWVEGLCCLWLNGQFIGSSGDQDTFAEFEVTSYLCEGENKLAVALCGRDKSNYVNYHNALRKMYLYAVPATHVENIVVNTVLADGLNQGYLEANISLSGIVKGTVGAILKDNVSKMLLVGHNPAEIEMQFQYIVPQVKLWDKESGFFYTLLLIIFDDEDNIIEVVPYDIRFVE